MEALLALSHRRWAVPLLVELQRLGGAKFVTLRQHLGVSPNSLSQTLGELTSANLVERNPGYGHPLRPEYVLTPRGKALGPACDALLLALDAHGWRQVGLHKWSLPVLACLCRGPARFGQLRTALHRVTPRALQAVLTRLAGAGLVCRGPQHVYRLCAEARSLCTPLAALVHVLSRV